LAGYIEMRGLVVVAIYEKDIFKEI